VRWTRRGRSAGEARPVGDHPRRVARAPGPTGGRPACGRLLIDLIEEYARHVGHADLIRESVDGLTGEDPTDNPYPYEFSAPAGPV